ncbi:unnamed protein product [Eruca vesicaria subsp. sativa]|uniref:Uncharacterized protein n=1 Tax=Eruca vesicaria subsp. sativa TaxID=29727 RepID=A0ABC8L4B4_ERUVS|nr:unnamed protein product [Eruca vesicaria subsp. sativa]
MTLDILWVYQYINAQLSNPQRERKECLVTFLSWFAPLSAWNGKLRKSAKVTGMSFKRLKGQGGPNPFFNPHTIYFFHRPVQINGKTGKILALPTLIHHKDFQRGLRPDFNINDIKLYEEFQTHAFRLNNARKNFAIPFTPNWLYYPIDYQMSLDEDLMFYSERRRLASYEPKPMKQEPQEPQTQECPPEYFQDAQLPDDSMNIDKIGKVRY